MEQAPKSLRLRIGFFGKTNTGKSSLLNLLTGQSTAIVSEQAGTTTDVVEKNMELPPVGPVILVDTAGLDDTSVLGPHRIAATEKAMKAANIDLLMCNMVTYATSSVFAPIIRDADIPMILVALQPLRKLDYTKASTFMQLENDNICSVPEFTGVANRLGKKIYDVIIGTLYNDDEADKELTKWCDIAKVLHDLNGARMGLMGHTMEAMYDMHADPTAVAAALGVHVPLLEVYDLVEVYETVTEEEIQAKISVIDEEFDMPEPKSDPVQTQHRRQLCGVPPL